MTKNKFSKGLIFVLVLGINFLGMHRQACAVADTPGAIGDSHDSACHGEKSENKSKSALINCCFQEITVANSFSALDISIGDLPLIFWAGPPQNLVIDEQYLAGMTLGRGPPIGASPPVRDLYSVRLN